MALDLASFASVRAFVPAFAATHDRLDILVDNAGVILKDRRATDDGHETQFQVNHLGPLPAHEPVPRPARRRARRRGVVIVSSDAHRFARRGLDFDDLESTHRYRGFPIYGRTKLMNLLFTRELARRLDGTGVTANAVHPGLRRDPLRARRRHRVHGQRRDGARPAVRQVTRGRRADVRVRGVRAAARRRDRSVLRQESSGQARGARRGTTSRPRGCGP